MIEFSEALLAEMIRAELDALSAMALNSVDHNNPYHVRIPDINTVDLPLNTIAELVARTSNNYATLARLAGMAKAHQKICQGRYERKYKRLRTVGKNEAERVAYAFEQCEQEHADMTASEALYAIAEALEGAARIASESARKIFDKAANSRDGDYRAQGAGEISAKDLSSW